MGSKSVALDIRAHAGIAYIYDVLELSIEY